MKGKKQSEAAIEANDTLACLPAEEKRMLRPQLQLTELKTKEEINEVGSRIQYIYFPVTAAISLMDIQPEGHAVEVTVVGREGAVGFSPVLGYGSSPGRLIVQVGGEAFRSDIRSFLALLDSLPCLRKMLIRFAALLFREAIISVGCSQFHSVEQRLGRWLLAHRHRTGQKIFPFTHDFLAEQIGVQRVTVTQALSSLQDRGFLKYGYGTVEVVDISSLERVSCECFRAATQAIDEYFHDIRRYK